MSNAASITVRVPLVIRRRGGRKLVLTPDGGGTPGAAPAPAPARTRAPTGTGEGKRTFSVP